MWWSRRHHRLLLNAPTGCAAPVGLTTTRTATCGMYLCTAPLGAAPSPPRAVDRGTPRSVAMRSSPVRWTSSVADGRSAGRRCCGRRRGQTSAGRTRARSDGPLHIRDICAAHDVPRPLVDHGLPDPARVAVACIGRLEQLATQPRSQVRKAARQGRGFGCHRFLGRVSSSLGQCEDDRTASPSRVVTIPFALTRCTDDLVLLEGRYAFDRFRLTSDGTLLCRADESSLWRRRCCRRCSCWYSVRAKSSRRTSYCAQCGRIGSSRRPARPATCRSYVGRSTPTAGASSSPSPRVGYRFAAPVVFVPNGRPSVMIACVRRIQNLVVWEARHGIHQHYRVCRVCESFYDAGRRGS